MEPGQSYGQTLPDQVERIATFFDTQLAVISDVRELYRERVALEREYAAKLQVLTRKASDKKSKLEAALVVGEDPTKSWDKNTLRQSTLDAAYTEIINSMSNTAQDHINIADALTSQVVEVLRAVERKNDDTKKKELQYFQKLLSDRDRTYSERIKSKQKYDEECGEVESYRQKQGRAQDDRHADRAAKQAEQQRDDMLNSKNVYLISISIANKTKDKFYDEDLPTLEDQFQSLQRRLIERFTKILSHAQTLQTSHLEVLKSRIARLDSTLGNVNTVNDQSLFIDHNIRPFTAPPDWNFEPCANHYDTADMSVDPAPKIFLQNKLARCRSKLTELAPLIDAKKRELEQLRGLVSAYNADHALGNIDEVSDNFLEVAHQLAFYTTSERILSTEIDLIVAAVGDDEGAQRPHSFKSSSFSIPTQCGYCKSSIWGLSKQGKTCKLCGLSVHSKCELKVPADCQSADGVRKSTVLSRTPTTASANTGRDSLPTQVPTASSFVQSAASEESYEQSYPTARVIFDYTATSEFELSVADGDLVQIIEPDDGSGWVKVVDEKRRDGLVPASYLDHEDQSGSSDAQGSGQRVRALYPYEVQGEDELSLVEGEVLELTSGPTGGQNYGNGWWEGVNSKGRKGLFPSNYVEML